MLIFSSLHSDRFIYCKCEIQRKKHHVKVSPAKPTKSNRDNVNSDVLCALACLCVLCLWCAVQHYFNHFIDIIIDSIAPRWWLRAALCVHARALNIVDFNSQIVGTEDGSGRVAPVGKLSFIMQFVRDCERLDIAHGCDDASRTLNGIQLATLGRALAV